MENKTLKNVIIYLQRSSFVLNAQFQIKDQNTFDEREYAQPVILLNLSKIKSIGQKEN
jgi:hypothetical protein